MAPKSEVYTWRISSSTKQRLEEAARASHRSAAHLLDDIVADYFSSNGARHGSDEENQRRLHARAARLAGCLAGSGRRAERVRALVRAGPKRKSTRGG